MIPTSTTDQGKRNAWFLKPAWVIEWDSVSKKKLFKKEKKKKKDPPPKKSNAFLDENTQ